MSDVNSITGINAAAYTEYTETPAATTDPQTELDFTAALAEALKDEAARMSVTAGTGMSGMQGYMPLQSQGLEQMILSAASSGQVSDAQTALFMLCMMMQSNQDGEFSMLMQMMASLLTNIQDESQKLRDSVMSSDYDPYVLDTVDNGVFGTRISAIAGPGGAILPVEAWRPATPAVKSYEDNRSPELYRAVINQFNVETSERYRPGRNDSTYCNIFVWDVTRAMGAEIPHYTDPETGEPRYYPDTKGAKSMGAIATDEWLQKYGQYYGWQEVDAETAQMHANEGKPAVTSAGSLGHVQIICPSRDGEYDPVRGVTVAQAGRIVTNFEYISGTFSAAGRQNVRYWIHN